MNGRRRRQERGEEEGAKRALVVEGRALRGDVLAAPHCALNLQVQGLVLLLRSGTQTKSTGETMAISLTRR